MSESTPTPPSDFGNYFAPTPTGATAPAPSPQFAPPSPQFAAPPAPQFAAPPSPQFGAPPAPGTSGSGPVFLAPTSRNSKAFIAAAAAAVVLAVGGYTLFGRSAHHSLSTPATIAGYQLVSDPQLDSLKQSLIDRAQGVGGLKKMAMGVYSQGSVPSAMVIAIQPEHDVSAAFDDMKSAFESDATSAITPVDAGPLGGDMDCGVIATASASPTMCVWRDDDTIGVVGLFFQSVTVAPPLAVQFRDAVEH